MIPNTGDREFSSNGVTSAGTFGISMKNQAHIMGILRDTIYSDKILAPLREYTCNAWDAHRSVGKGDVPIEVTLPTEEDPTLSIRDFGPGMSEEFVFYNYTMYGDSLKRFDNDQVGTLGIGSKSGFAYSDTFMVTSWHGGMKKIYSAVLDKSDKGTINLMHSEPCGEETGLLIQIPVKRDDIDDFVERAKSLFVHFVPRPKVNVELPEQPADILHFSSGYVSTKVVDSYNHRGEWIAVMGCVPYKVDLKKVAGAGKLLPSYYTKISGALYFNIGEVQFNASREELKYSDTTKAAIVSKITTLLDEFVARVLHDVHATETSHWDKRVKAQVLSRLGIPTTNVGSDIAASHVPIGDVPEEFYVTQRRSKDRASSLYVSETARVLLLDSGRAVRGYYLTSNDYVVRRRNRTKWENVKAALDKFLEDKKLTGVPVLNISSLPYQGVHRSGGVSRTDTPKASLRVFSYNERRRYSRASSDAWTPEESRTPTDDDVYVILERFETAYDFTYLYAQDSALLEKYAVKMPIIYGYRSTETAPVNPATLKGAEYRTWAKKVLLALAEEHKHALELYAYSVRWRLPLYEKLQARNVLTEALGQYHDITSTIWSVFLAAEYVSQHESTFTERVRMLHDRLKRLEGYEEETQYLAGRAAKRWEEKYPMLFHGYLDITDLWDSVKSKPNLDYIRMVDEKYLREDGNS